MINWFKRKITWFLDTWEEADSVDPWRSKPWNDHWYPSGIRLFDLASLHLKDHGYHVRLYRNSNMMVVFKSRWRYFLDNRVGSIAFEVGRADYKNDRFTQVWYFGFGKKYALHAGTSVSGMEKPDLLCEVTDPFCMNRILEKTNEYYRS